MRERGNQSHTRVNIQPRRHKWHTQNTPEKWEHSSAPLWPCNRVKWKTKSWNVCGAGHNSKSGMKFFYIEFIYLLWSPAGIDTEFTTELGFAVPTRKHTLFTLCHVSNISFCSFFRCLRSFEIQERRTRKKGRKRRGRGEMRSGNSTHWDDTILFHPPDHACKFLFFGVFQLRK